MGDRQGEMEEDAGHIADAAWLARISILLPALLALLIMAGLAGVLLNIVEDKLQFSGFLFLRQDLIFAIAIALICRRCLSHNGARDPTHDPAWMRRVGTHPVVVAALLTLICWAGHQILFQNYDLTRDEQMAVFDAFIYAHGHVSWPIAPGWQPFTAALNDLFILPTAGDRAWVSDYLPVNALLRAAVGHFISATWTSPLLVAAGALALWRITLRLWPDDLPARTVALLLYCGSSQIVITGMTAYAMTGHLALNLIWLALFLRGGWNGHGAALVVGFLATGLHQPLFHPLFVLPFLALLLAQRRWRTLGLYCAGYAIIGLFWLSWPHFVAEQAGGGAVGRGQLGYGDRIVMLLSGFQLANFWLMALNFIRFVAWQHLLLLPLAVGGAALCGRDPLVRALAGGILLHLLAATLLLAYQGHGWGYRYLHGVLGSACLLGGFCWHRLRGNSVSSAIWISANLATFLIALPAHAFITARFVAPYAKVSALLDAKKADVVIVDDAAVAFAADLVINQPDLRNRPVRLLASKLDAKQVTILCRDRTVAFIGPDILAPISAAIPTFKANNRHFADLEYSCASVSAPASAGTR